MNYLPTVKRILAKLKASKDVKSMVHLEAVEEALTEELDVLSEGPELSHSPWHERPILKGVYGQLSKIQEELDEARDAEEQGLYIMLLIELSDLYGALAGYCDQNGMLMSDLAAFGEKVRDIRREKKPDVNLGVGRLSLEASEVERQLFQEYGNLLNSKGYSYLSLPSLIPWEVLKRTGYQGPTCYVDHVHALTGSAEQGFLYAFQDMLVAQGRYWSINQCFRSEPVYQEGVWLKEFKKLEQYIVCSAETWQDEMTACLDIVCDFLTEKGVTWEIVATPENAPVDAAFAFRGQIYPGMVDIYATLENGEKLETHTCTYFDSSQAEAMGMRGGVHTISCTGLASPRILKALGVL
jgi:hypothetical protein